MPGEHPARPARRASPEPTGAPRRPASAVPRSRPRTRRDSARGGPPASSGRSQPLSGGPKTAGAPTSRAGQAPEAAPSCPQPTAQSAGAPNFYRSYAAPISTRDAPVGPELAPDQRPDPLRRASARAPVSAFDPRCPRERPQPRHTPLHCPGSSPMARNDDTASHLPPSRRPDQAPPPGHLGAGARPGEPAGSNPARPGTGTPRTANPSPPRPGQAGAVPSPYPVPENLGSFQGQQAPRARTVLPHTDVRARFSRSQPSAGASRSGWSTSSMRAIGAPSPTRRPSLMIRV